MGEEWRSLDRPASLEEQSELIAQWIRGAQATFCYALDHESLDVNGVLSPKQRRTWLGWIEALTMTLYLDLEPELETAVTSRLRSVRSYSRIAKALRMPHGKSGRSLAHMLGEFAEDGVLGGLLIGL